MNPSNNNQEQSAPDKYVPVYVGREKEYKHEYYLANREQMLKNSIRNYYIRIGKPIPEKYR